MPENFNPWETESGLPDDFNLTITEAWFAKDARYKDGEVLLLHWQGTVEKDGEEEELENPIIFPCGSGWDSYDGGKTAEHEKGRKRFIGSSVYGRLIDRCVKDLGMMDLMLKRGDPKAAKVWVGLKFHLKREKIEFGSKLEPIERLMPDKFLGEVRSGKLTPPKGTKTKAEPKPEPEPEPEEKTEAKAESSDKKKKLLLAKLQAIAKKAETFEEFYEKAVEIEGVTDDEEILAQVIDEEAGIYVQVKGKE
ncbi:MAG: hypothetical protein K6U74_04335 [Firmicutes bacterium]|nr:hypothetical protein [Bacillota bacterium]